MDIAAGFAQVKFVFHLVNDPEDMVCTVGLQLDNAPSSVALQAIYDSFVDNMLPLLNEEYEFRGIQVAGKATGGTEYQTELYSTATGGSGGPVCPQNTAILLQKRTGLAGRRNRGRCYLPGMAQEGEIASNGVLSPLLLGLLQTGATGWLNDLKTLVGGDDVVINHKPSTIPPSPVSAFVIDDIVATQRKRLR